MAMNRARLDYLVQGNATIDEVDHIIDFCLMFANEGTEARCECCESYRLWVQLLRHINENHMKTWPLRF